MTAQREIKAVIIFSALAFALAALYQGPVLLQVWRTGFFSDSDDAMRLVQVRDFLSGQSWFDLTQYRMNPPEGVVMHWSRLVDVPLAALISLFTLLTNSATAETLARLAWPGALQLVFFTTLLLITRRLAGPSALFPAALLAGLQWIVAQQFMPGRIDHHNVQLVLAALAVYAALRQKCAARNAAWCGFFCAALIAVGVELAAVVAILAAFYVLLWMRHGTPHTKALRFFSTSFALSSAGLFLTTTPVSRLTLVTCDSQSFASLGLALVGGALVFMLTGAALHTQLLSRAKRCGALLIAVSLLAITAYHIAAPCFSGPFSSVPPDLQEFWLNHVREAKGLFQHMRAGAVSAFAVCACLLASVACSLVMALRATPQRAAWIMLFILVLVHTALIFVQIRAMYAPLAFALPAGAALAATLRPWMRAAVIAALTPGVWLIPALAFAPEDPALRQDCFEPARYRALAALPSGSVLAPVALGSFILNFTPHTVFAAPYHRNVEGLRVLMTAGRTPPPDAHAFLSTKHVNYVMLCTTPPDARQTRSNIATPFYDALMNGKAVPGLTPLPGDGPLKIWRVD